jgi:3-methyladenine DNA glycosylase/8-oxoguanine DNA glycosylase
MTEMDAADRSTQDYRAATLPILNGASPIMTISVLRQGARDPQMRVGDRIAVRAVNTSAGPATLEIFATDDAVQVRAWGPGADVALSLVPGLIGNLDDASTLKPHHRLVAELVRARPGLRLTRSGSVIDALVVSILAQKITGEEAQRSYAQLLYRHGEVAPGPYGRQGLRVPPPPEKLARLPYWAFHPLGVERRRADTIRAAAAVAPQLERIASLAPDERSRRLRSLNGVGEWTAAETMRIALGDPDAVSVGDYHLPRVICWALAGEARGSDERMLELLEPYRGQRARVALLIEHGVARQARRAPRMRLRSFAAY